MKSKVDQFLPCPLATGQEVFKTGLCSVIAAMVFFSHHPTNAMAHERSWYQTFPPNTNVKTILNHQNLNEKLS